jgi:predicted nucleic acid-binding protein
MTGVSDASPTPKMAVLDANIVVYVITDPAESSSAKLWHTLTRDHLIVMPALARWEITNAFYRSGRFGQMALEDVDDAVVAFQQLGIIFEDQPQDHFRAVGLARQFDFQLAYDAHYLALAERLGCGLWTADKALHSSASKAFPWVNLVRR